MFFFLKSASIHGTISQSAPLRLGTSIIPREVAMRITYDSETDAAYIYLVNSVRPGEAKKTYVCDPSEMNGMINLDFDAFGRLLGIEVLCARQQLPPELLDQAERL